jgi:[ribosomal protein S5]-alanine N-acetyltransferase
VLGPDLLGQVVRLGPLLPEHLPSYCRWFADPEVTAYLLRDHPPTLAEEQEWYDRVSRGDGDVIWAVFAGDQHIGGAGLHQIDWRNRRAISGTLIGERSFWGRGIATDAMRLRTRYAFDQLGLEKLITHVIEGNTASRRALERVGYRTVGIHRHHEFRRGAWHDAWVGELLRDDWLAAHPPEAP